MFSIIKLCWATSSSPSSKGMVPLAAELKRSYSRLTVTQSSYLVTAQKPGPPGSSCQWTGSWRRRWANQAWGTPAT